MFERFTDRARKVMQLATQEAQRRSHEYVGSEHLLLGMIKEHGGVAAHVLRNRGLDLTTTRKLVDTLVPDGPDQVTFGRLPQTPRAKRVVEQAIVEAVALDHNYVDTAHLLLGLLTEPEGVPAQVFAMLDVVPLTVRAELLGLLRPIVAPSQGGTMPATLPSPPDKNVNVDDPLPAA